MWQYWKGRRTLPKTRAGLEWRGSHRRLPKRLFRGSAKTKNPKKMHLQGSNGTSIDGEWLDGVRRGWRWKCVVGKCSTHPHALAREVQAAGAGAWLRISLRCFDKTWRTPPCTPDGMVGVEKDFARKSCQKSRRRWGFSDSDTVDWKALGDGEGDRNETRSLKGFLELNHG